MQDDAGDLDKLRLAEIPSPVASGRRIARHLRRQVPFVKGPIPVPWIAAASRQPGRALHVAMAIWYLAGLSRTLSVELRPSTVRQFGVDRYAAYRGLHALERAGLVAVRRHRGRCPTVTILRATEPFTNGDLNDAQPA